MKPQTTQKLIPLTLLTSSLAFLVSCAATQTVLEHHSLETSTKQSQTVFLDPVANDKKTVFVSVKNTSDEEVNITSRLKTALSQQGYRVMSEPTRAHYLLQANVLKVGKMSRSASESALGGGYGSAIAGGLVGSALGSLTHRDGGSIGGGIAGGILGLAADSLVKDVNYTMITDIQISEKVARGVRVREQVQSTLKNGSSTHLKQTLEKESAYQRYRTRIVSNANQVNLTFAKARSALETGLVKAIAGIF